MTINKKPSTRRVFLSPAFIKKARKHVADNFDTIEDAAVAMGFTRWQTLSELLNRKTCRQSSLDKINAALNPEANAVAP